MGRRVWVHEVIGFIFRDRVREDGRTVTDHLGGAQDHEEEASRPARAPRRQLS